MAYILFVGKTYYAHGPEYHHKIFDDLETAQKYIAKIERMFVFERGVKSFWYECDWYRLMQVSGWTCIAGRGHIHGEDEHKYPSMYDLLP